jgi:hypothetical protein
VVTPFTAIYAIQGSGDASPLVGQTVTTEGVVTANFQVGGKNGYFIQDPVGDGDPATSDGIFVYSTNPAVNVGDALRITGKVSEYYNLTQLTPTNSGTVMTCGSGQTIAPLALTLPTTAPRSYEAYEGMLVTFPQELYISEYYNYDRYGEIVLASSRHFSPTHSNEPGADAIAAEAAYQLDMIKVDDTLGTQNPPYLRHPDGSQFTKEHYFRGGDTVTGLTGVMDYNFGEYKIQPVGTATYESLNPRPAAPSLVEGEIRIASLNVLNYFVTIDDGSNNCGPAGNMNCRGADTAEEFTRQRDKIIAAILGMEADVIGLIEIENEHPGIAADAAVIDLVAGLNDATAAGTYAYVATGNIGTDAIKQAFIYKPAKVDQIGTFAILDETFNPAYDTTRNRPSLAVSFKDKITNEIFTVSVNHLKSKGSACAGDPDLGDGQGNCNLTRKAAAEVLVDWLETDPTNAGSGMYVIIGDLNSYAKEDPIDAIKLGADGIAETADDVINLVERFRGDNAYGYVYDGRTGYLDHALANKKFASYVLDANFWNINADEADVFDYDMTFKPVEQEALYSPDAYRSSDHDPVLISLILNHPPTAVDDEYTTTQGVALEVDAPGVLANDTDPNIYDKITASLVANSGPENGTLVFNEDGSFVYTPNPEFSGIDTFEYTMHATPGLMAEYSDTATVTINVTFTNTAPELYPIEDQSVTALTTLTFTAEAADPELPEQTLTFSLVGAPEGATIDPATGVFTWTPTAEQGSQVYNFTVKVCDDGTPVLCDETPVKVTVLPPNIAPELYPIADTTVDELVELSFEIGASDPDLPDQTLTFSLVDAPEGAVIDAASGLFTWTPTEAQGPDVYTITVRVCDDGAPVLCDESSFDVTVNEVNVAPSIDPTLEDMTINEMELTTFTVVAVDPDLPANTLTYSLVGAPDGAAIDATTGEFTWTPTEAQGPGVYTFTVRVCDDGEPILCDEQELTITVLEVNLPPVAVDDAYTTDEDVVLTVPAPGVLENDTDPESPVLTAVLVETVSHGELVLNADGSFVYTPAQDYNGTDTFTYKASDGELDDIATVTITINPVNDAPVAVDDAYTVAEDNVLTVTAPGVLENDYDVDGDALSATLRTNVSHGVLVLLSDGSFTYTPDPDFFGTDSFTYNLITYPPSPQPEDGWTDWATVTITVTPVNDAPVLDEIPDFTIPELAPFSFIATASDVDDTELTFSLTNPPAGAAINPETGEFTWTPTHDQVGEHEITLCVSDGELEDCQTFKITVTAVNTSPVAVADEYSLNQDQMLTIAAPGVLENDSDADNDPLTAVLVSTTQHGTLILSADGSFIYVPDAGYYGEDTFTYKAFDGEYYSEVVTVTLTIIKKPVWMQYFPIIKK